VISAASDDDMREAQRHLHAALNLLLEFRGNSSPENIIESLGPAIFLFIMTLLRSGQRTALEAVMGRIANLRQVTAAPRHRKTYELAAMPDPIF
jgi:hypothetical protein